MREEMKNVLQTSETEEFAPGPEPNGDQHSSRREFLGGALASASGVALATLLGAQPGEAQRACVSSSNCQPAIGGELVNPGELKSGTDGFLRGVVTVEGDLRNVAYYHNGNFFCKTHEIRSYNGFDGFTLQESKRVTKQGTAAPGPTFRAKLGDTVQLMFLNLINKTCFPETPLTGEGGGCEVTKSASGQELYPKNASTGFEDKYPDCFRVSNTTNIHFHGTHVTPGGFGDNVLVGVLPNRGIPTQVEFRQCAELYKLCTPGNSDPLKWKTSGDASGQAKWRAFQSWLNQANLYLQKLSPAAVQSNQVNLRNGEWPQYWPGYYPFYFTIPKYEKGKTFPVAGQCPGTHWYHAHQHGSTSIQLLNGMAGALIVTGDDYDGKILMLGGGSAADPRIKEKVLVLQLFAEVTNLMAGGAGQNPQSLMVNGQLNPTVAMKRGEVQWWRIVNTSIKSHGIQNFFFMEKSKFEALPKFPNPNAIPQPTDVGTVPRFRTIARDGVQFAWENYTRHLNETSYRLSPGNRLDLLVKAPDQDGDYLLVFWPPPQLTKLSPPQVTDPMSQIVLSVKVAGPATTENTHWYEAASTPPPDYPIFPDFLGDIQPEEIRIRRTVTFSMERTNTQQPVVKIDGVQFNEGVINKIMLEGDAEEWTLVNTSLNSVMHPFHIHVNPFQIVETYDPTKPNQPVTTPDKFIWQDTIAIPAGATVDGKFAPGYVKIRHRFLDFPGKYVLHCHILGHEDRGMMQLVEMIANNTVVKHH